MARRRANWLRALIRDLDAVENHHREQIKSATEPTKPNSSPKLVKMKSVCFSGRKLRRLCVPLRKPLPERPPEPMRSLAWVMFQPAPKASASGLRKSSPALSDNHAGQSARPEEWRSPPR